MIYYSKKESKNLNLKIGRIETENLQKRGFFQAVLKEEYDLIRLKIDSKHFDINHQIEKLGFPAYYCGSILRYHMHFFELTKPSFKIPNAEFVFYEQTHQQQLFDLICESFRDDPVGYYKNPLISQLLSKDQEVASMANYYVEQMQDERNKMVFLKLDGLLVGFISIFYVEDGTIDTPISGVARKYRGMSVFDDLRSFRHKYCLENNIPLGLAGARSENFYSQKTFVRDGMVHVGNESIYQITPLLSAGAKSAVSHDFRLNCESLQDALVAFQEKVVSLHEEIVPLAEFYLVAGRTCINHPFVPSPAYRLSVAKVIEDSRKILTVSKIYDQSNELSVVIYSQFQRF